MVAAVALEEAREYRIALILAICGAVSLAATIFHWKGWPSSAGMTLSGRFLGYLFSLVLLLLSVLLIVGNKGNQPWSRFPGDWTLVVSRYVTSQRPDLPTPDRPSAPVPPAYALSKSQPTTSSVRPRTSESRTTGKVGTQGPPLETLSNTPVQLSAVFENPSSLSLAVFNPSDDVVEDVSWAMVAFRASDLSYFGFETEPIGYIKPHARSLNYAMNLETIRKSTDGDGQIKEGDELTGSVSIDRPKCTIRTYIVHLIWKRQGWYFEFPQQVGYVVPKDMSKEGRARYIRQLTDEQYANQRIEIKPQ